MSDKLEKLGVIGCILSIIFFPILVIFELAKKYSGSKR